MLQCSTLDSVTSHKVRLILEREQLRGLWSEIRRCTLPTFFASAAWLLFWNVWRSQVPKPHAGPRRVGMNTLKGENRQSNRRCVCVCVCYCLCVCFHWQPQGPAGGRQGWACNREVWCTRHEALGQLCGKSFVSTGQPGLEAFKTSCRNTICTKSHSSNVLMIFLMLILATLALLYSQSVIQHIARADCVGQC